MRRTSRYMALLLSGLMCMQTPFQAGAAINSEHMLTLERCAGADSGYEVSTKFDPFFFLSGNSVRLASSGLAELSAALAMASYGYDEGVLWMKKEKNDTLDLLKQMGFTNTRKRFSGNGKEDGCSTREDLDHGVLYSGTMLNSVGGKNLLIAGVIDGYSDGGWEWTSNFNLGIYPVHQGFNKAANEIVKMLDEEAQSQGMEKSQVKFWLTGHSRGAALANLVAIKLIDKGYSKYNVYAYGFATPQYTRNVTGEYGSAIINFVSPHDFVPFVAPAAWGYGREGENIIFDENLLTAMEVQYKKAVGKDYKGYTARERQELIDAFTDVGRSVEEYNQDVIQSYLDASDLNSYFDLTKLEELFDKSELKDIFGIKDLKSIVDVRELADYLNLEAVKEEVLPDEITKPSQYAQFGIGYAMNSELNIKAMGLENMVLTSLTDDAAGTLNELLIRGIGANRHLANQIANSHNMITYLEWISAWKEYSRAGGFSDDFLSSGTTAPDIDVLYETMKSGIADAEERFKNFDEATADAAGKSANGAAAMPAYLKMMVSAIDTKLEADYSEEVQKIEDVFIETADSVVTTNERINNGLTTSMKYLDVIARELDIYGDYTTKITDIAESYQDEAAEIKADENLGMYDRIDEESVLAARASAEYLEIIALKLDRDGEYADRISDIVEKASEEADDNAETGQRMANEGRKMAELLNVLACEFAYDDAAETETDEASDTASGMDAVAAIQAEYNSEDAGTESADEQMHSAMYASVKYLDLVAGQMAEDLFGPDED